MSQFKERNYFHAPEFQRQHFLRLAVVNFFVGKVNTVSKYGQNDLTIVTVASFYSQVAAYAVYQSSKHLKCFERAQYWLQNISELVLCSL